MKNIPVFDTENGVASLVLKEIPYTAKAYITIRASQAPMALLEECISFCRMCGAEEVFASGDPCLEAFPLTTAMYAMRCAVDSLPESDAALWPVQPESLEQFRSIYNEKASRLPNSAWMDSAEGRKMLEDGDGYFVHRDGKLLGIGRIADGEIRWVASVTPGGGRDVVLALAKAMPADVVELTVASVNEKAIRLYESLGFIKTREISRWYKVK